MRESADLLTFEHLSKTFVVGGLGGKSREVAALRDASVGIAAGSAVGLVGESGSGKTTLARILIGLERPSSGTVLLDGVPVSRDRSQARSIQMVFQDPYTSLDPRQTPLHALDEVQQVHFSRSSEQRRARSLELIRAVGLGEPEANALPRKLSGGQRQRAAIARALAAEPRILILDEAVSALDVSIQGQILNLLNDLRSKLGLTYLMISHDLAVVRQMVDTVLVMYRGYIVESGPIDAVLDRPQHPYTRRLRAAVPEAGKELAPRRAPTQAKADGCPFQHRCELVKDDCAREPELVPVGPNHLARCWRINATANLPKSTKRSSPVALNSQRKEL